MFIYKLLIYDAILYLLLYCLFILFIFVQEIKKSIEKYELFQDFHKNKIIQVLGLRSKKDRLKIRDSYIAMFHSSLITDLDSILLLNDSRNFAYLTRLLCVSSTEVVAHFIKDHDFPIYKFLIIPILCSHSSIKRQKLCQMFQVLFKENLPNYIEKQCEELGPLLAAMLKVDRNNIKQQDPQTDAKKIFKTKENRFNVDGTHFAEIISSRPFDHLRETFEKYEKLSNEDITESIRKEAPEAIQNDLIAIVGSIRNVAKQFTKSLHHMGNPDIDGIARAHTVSNILMIRCGVDMWLMKDEFNCHFKQSIRDWVIEMFSYDPNFCNLLLTLLTEEEYCIAEYVHLLSLTRKILHLQIFLYMYIVRSSLCLFIQRRL